MNVSPLSARAMSTYPLSIGTCLAIECFSTGPRPSYDPEAIPGVKITPGTYEELWVNLITLSRNMIGSVDRLDIHRVSGEELAQELTSEMEIISDVVKQFDPNLIIRFYSNSYRGVAGKYPRAKVRGNATPAKQAEVVLIGESIQELYKFKKTSTKLLHFDLAIKPIKRARSLFLTNYAHDLTYRAAFGEMDLLESYTGVVKTPAQWWTKFSDYAANRIPMTPRWLQVFGDSTLFYQHDRALRKQVLEIAEKFEWNHRTTPDRIALSLEKMPDKFSLAILKEMGA